MTRLVCIHGAWATRWIWEPLRAPLAERGIDLVGVALPGSRRERLEAAPDLLANVRAVERAIGEGDDRVVLVGHSGGSVTATAIAEAHPDRVAGVAHVAGMMLPSGVGYRTVCVEVGGEEFAGQVGVQNHLRRDGDVTEVPAEVAVAYFFSRTDPELAVSTARSLVPQHDGNRVMTAQWTESAAGRIPRLYVETTQDLSTPIAVQRRMQQRWPGADVVSLDADHAPQLSATDDLAQALEAFVRRVAPASGVVSQR